jgi:hypothetical protein
VERSYRRTRDSKGPEGSALTFAAEAFAAFVQAAADGDFR